jgi:hypothetical protein
MKLSESIRKGSVGTEQAFKVFFDGNKRDTLGAAMHGAGFPDISFIADFHALYRAILAKSAKCPEKCGLMSNVEGIVEHLNDDHRKSREEIATWLESLGL